MTDHETARRIDALAHPGLPSEAERRPRILVIEDDPTVRDGVAAALASLGHEVLARPDGERFEGDLATFAPDLVVLDVTLATGPDGFELAGRLGTHGAGAPSGAVPFLFLTASGDLDDRMRGFHLGADDYMVKPFSVMELDARIRVVLRRSLVGDAAPLVVGDLAIDVGARTVHRSGHPVALTPTEFDVLAALAARPGRPCTKRELLAEVWGYHDHAPHLVEVQVSSLRRKLEQFGPRVVVTCRGGAYLLRAER